MGSPFPGMDPYLEHPGLWPGFHHRLIVALADDIGPRVAPRYYVSVEEWAYIAGDEVPRRPDLAVAREAPAVHHPAASTVSPDVPRRVHVPVPELERQVYLEVRDATNGQLVSVIELLSPGNKQAGPGRQAYIQKRATILQSSAHLVEIDLLRRGQPMPVRPPHPAGLYSILVSRAESRPEAECYTFSLCDPIPPFHLPLGPGDAEPLVHLRACIDHVYESGSYARRIDYRAAPSPPLTPEDAAWVRGCSLPPGRGRVV